MKEIKLGLAGILIGVAVFILMLTIHNSVRNGQLVRHQNELQAKIDTLQMQLSELACIVSEYQPIIIRVK